MLIAPKPVIVFIEGPAPTDADKALFKQVNADQFVNVSLHGTTVMSHLWATAVDPALVPAGYTLTPPGAVVEDLAPVGNPTAPATPSTSVGTLGVQSEDIKPPVAPVFNKSAGK